METILWWWWVIPVILFWKGCTASNPDWRTALFFTALGMIIGHILNMPVLGLWWWAFPVFLVLKGMFFARDANSAFILWFTAIGSIIGYYFR